MALGDLLVIYGENVQKALLYDRLCRRFGADSVWWLNKKEHRKAPPKGCEGGTICAWQILEATTGLEAGVVFLIGMENLLSGSDTPSLGKEVQAAEVEGNTRKLYMAAMTRAGQYLILLSSQRVPAFIEDSFTQLADAPEPA